MDHLKDLKRKGLEILFSSLIAKEKQIPVEAVTVEFIREYRESKLYPTVKSGPTSAYGGYVDDGLIHLSRLEFDRLAEINDELLSPLTA